MTLRRVLVVEDDMMFRRLFEELFTAPGYAMRTVGSLEEALRAMASWRPHVVLADLHLPDGEGPWVIERLRRGARALLIAMSGDMDPARIAALRKAGAVGCIGKDDLLHGDLASLFNRA